MRIKKIKELNGRGQGKRGVKEVAEEKEIEENDTGGSEGRRRAKEQKHEKK